MSKKELDYKQFVDDFEEWVKTQVSVMQLAQKTAEDVYEKDNENMDAAVGMVRYESRVDAYKFLLAKFENFRRGKAFHELPPEFSGEKITRRF